MSALTLYGFPRSSFVNVVRMILTHKDVAFHFHDLESCLLYTSPSPRD